jgi:hypothetical protein
MLAVNYAKAALAMSRMTKSEQIERRDVMLRGIVPPDDLALNMK